MKYMGSKARLAKEILPIVLSGRGNRPYVEPFVGGANMIQHVHGERVGADSNAALIAMWSGLLSGTLVPRKVTREEYEQAKNSEDMAFRGWVGFNCSYSGKYFGGYAGETKTKIGTVRDYQAEAIRNVSKQVERLKGCRFLCFSYTDLAFENASTIYCDPPYEGTTEYKDKFNHAEFWQWCRDRAKDGHQIFVSEYSAPDDFVCVWEREVGSSLSANGKVGGRKNSVERLFLPSQAK